MALKNSRVVSIYDVRSRSERVSVAQLSSIVALLNAAEPSILDPGLSPL